MPVGENEGAYDGAFQGAFASPPNGSLDSAEKHYEGLIQRGIADAQVYSRLGLIYTETGRLDEAIRMLSSVLILDPKSASNHFNLGCALLKARQAEAAIGQFR
jgi:predicted Zn-dependent protease